MAHSNDGSDWSGVSGIQPYVFEPEPDKEQEASPAEAVEEEVVSEWQIYRCGKVHFEVSSARLCELMYPEINASC